MDERAKWDSVAAAWTRHWRHIESATGELNRRLIDRAGVSEGQTVLDVATGRGEPGLTAARRVGPAGRVTATDFSAGMLAEARARAEELGLRNVEFVECDAQTMDFVPESFDAAVCRWGLMLIPDPRAVLQRVLRLLKPGGRFAAAVWGPPERVPFLTVPRAIAARELGLPAPSGPGLEQPPNPLRLGRPGMTEELFREAGFDEVSSETVEVVFRFPSPEHYVATVCDMSSVMREALAGQPAEKRARLERAIADATEPYRDGAGQVALSNAAICVWGRRRLDGRAVARS